MVPCQHQSAARLCSGTSKFKAEPMKLDIATEFSPYPAGRYYPQDGEHTGDRFRDKFLLPKLNEVMKERGRLVVVLDGVRTFGSSFLEEAFGGLVRKKMFTAQDLKKFLKFEYSKKSLVMYEDAIWEYIARAKPEK